MQRTRSVLDWCGGYILISFISYGTATFAGFRDGWVQVALALAVIATLWLNGVARASSRRHGASVDAAMPLAFLLVCCWLVQFLALDLIVHLRMEPDEGYWKEWWDRNGFEVLGYVPLFILVVWSDLVWSPARRRGPR